MLKLGLILLIISFQDITANVTDGTELVMAFLIHRHGDRTPTKFMINYSNNAEALELLTAPYGYGQLTNVGKQRSFELGKYIRARYSKLLGRNYKHSEVYFYSTDSNRCKMSIVTALAAIYPSGGDDWNENLKWGPVPFSTVPFKYDHNMFLFNCPTVITAMTGLINSPSESFSLAANNITDILTNYTGVNITKFPGLLYPIYDLYTSQINLGLRVYPELEAIWSDVEKAAGASLNLTMGAEEFIALYAGVLLNEFHEYSRKTIAGGNTPKLRVYSVHDVNVFAFQAVTQVAPRQGVPKYASAYSLEVRRVTATGKYVVLPVYLPEPGQEVVYLQVKGCDLLCDYDRFIDITRKYTRDVAAWRADCDFREDMAIDEDYTE